MHAFNRILNSPESGRAQRATADKRGWAQRARKRHWAQRATLMTLGAASKEDTARSKKNETGAASKKSFFFKPAPPGAGIKVESCVIIFNFEFWNK